MKKYNIPISWIQQGLITIEADTLKDASKKLESLDIAPLNVVGQTAPGSTRIAYTLLKNYIPDEHLSDSITLYTSSKVPQCPFCDKARTFFKENRIEFNEIDVVTNEPASQYMFSRTNVMNMPQIEVGNEITVGFNEEDLKGLLIKYGYLVPKDIPTNAPPVPTSPPPASEEPANAKVVKLEKEKDNAK